MNKLKPCKEIKFVKVFRFRGKFVVVDGLAKLAVNGALEEDCITHQKNIAG
jgi:hypothetical protein